MSLPPEEFAQLFKTETIKLFIDYIIHDMEAYIIVKSWQKVQFVLKEEEEDKNRNNSRMMNRNQQQNNMKTPVLDKQLKTTAMYSQPNQQQAKNTFYIKTLEVCNKFGQSLSPTGPILVEQVFGDFDQVRLYDTSYVQKKEKLYFFKRHFVNPEEYDENGQLKELEEEVEEWDLNNPYGVHLQNSNLTLHEYDFKNSKEKIVQEIYFRENDETQPFGD